ncbi:MAG: exonuclease domain-containing protein [Acutalibacteraceae bacterium]
MKMTDRIIAFDLEMPGQREPKISAIGITVVEKGRVTDNIYYLVNPETEFDPYVIKLVGITPEMVKDEPTFPEIWEKIKDIMDSGLIVAHGASGDMKTLCACLHHYSIPWHEKVRYACTCEMGLQFYPYLEGHSLDCMCAHIGFDLHHHLAVSDSEGCARLCIDFMENGIDPADFAFEFDTVNCCKIRQNKVRKKRSLEQRVQNALLNMRQEKLTARTIRRNPDVEADRIIGVSEKSLRIYASRLIQKNKAADYLRILPHVYHEENCLHALIISERKKYSSCIELIEKFLPYIDSEDVCEMLDPKIFRLRQPELVSRLTQWYDAQGEYGKLLAVNLMIRDFVTEEHLTYFSELLMRPDDSIKINTKRAEFFAEALIRYPKSIIPFFLSGRLDKWTHNMALQIAAYTKGVSDEEREKYVALRMKK